MDESTTAPSTTLGDAAASLALADSSSATPATETPADTPAPAATMPAAGETQEPASVSTEEPPKGEPPKWRWQDILANARETTAKETEARVKQEVEQQYGWAKDFNDLSAEERSGALIWSRALRGDPQALWQVEQVRPDLAMALRGQTQVQAPQAPEPEPQPDAAIQLADGSTVPVFTAEGKRKHDAWLQKHLESSLAERFQPLAHTADQLKRHQELAAQQQQHRDWAQKVMGRVAKLPNFEEYKPAIQKALSELPANFNGDLEETVFATYAQLHAAKLDALPKELEAKVLANLQQRAVAGTPNPAAASVATPASTLGNARAALEHAERSLSGAA